MHFPKFAKHVILNKRYHNIFGPPRIVSFKTKNLESGLRQIMRTTYSWYAKAAVYLSTQTFCYSATAADGMVYNLFAFSVVRYKQIPKYIT